MTERLYYSDSYLQSFQARIVGHGSGPCEVFLDRTAFYPASGGQPHDTGSIAGVAVTGVVDDGDRIRHHLAAPLETGGPVSCQIDWRRRFDHMQQHSGQHLLSAVFAELFGARTVSFHLGSDVSTIELATPGLRPEQICAAEQRAGELVFENHPLEVSYEEAAGVRDLRKASGRKGMLRVISIPGIDRSACGGTHVRSTGEIGAIMIRKTERIRGHVRIEFLCGSRAARRARADYDALERCARVFSATLEETPQLVALQREKLITAERERKRMTRELAALKGERLYHGTEPGAAGLRFHLRSLDNGPIGDDLRAEAQAYTNQPRAVFVALSRVPPVALLAASTDSGIHAGELLRKLLVGAGGRGGGNQQLAQGSLPSAEALAEFERELRGRF